MSNKKIITSIIQKNYLIDAVKAHQEVRLWAISVNPSHFVLFNNFFFLLK